jgi:hypothetical protein
MYLGPRKSIDIKANIVKIVNPIALFINKADIYSTIILNMFTKIVT